LKEIVEKDFINFNKIVITGFEKDYNRLSFEVLTKLGLEKPNFNKKINPKKLTKIAIKLKKNKNSNVIWNTFASKFFLKNINKDFWGWYDKKAIEAIDFWKDIDSQILFIFNYISLEESLKKNIDNNRFSTIDDIDRHINKWIEYHKKMIKEFYRNRDRVLLVHNSLFSIENIEKKIGSIDKIHKRLKEIKSYDINASIDNIDGITTYFISNYIKDNIEVQNIYNELKVLSHYSLKQENFKFDQKVIFNSFIDMRINFNKIIKEKNKLKKENEKNTLFLKENDLLLLQLMSVQEELEKYYLENKSLKNQLEEKKRYYGASDRIKQQLSYRLGATMIEKSKSIRGIISLPFTLLKVHSQYKKEMKDRKNQPKLPLIHTYADYYEAERVKKHLSYRLGQAMVNTLKGNPFGIFILPFKLRAIYKEFKRERN